MTSEAPRKKGRGGGLAVVYKSQLMVQTLQPRATASMECMEIDLTRASQKLSFCLIYRSPRHFGSAFLEEFVVIVDSYSVISKCHIILGDFNVHKNSDTSADAARLLTGLRDAGLVQLVQGPTHTKDHTLDLVITRDNDPLVESVTTDHPHLSDHMVVVCYLALEKPQPIFRDMQYHVLNRIDCEDFR